LINIEFDKYRIRSIISIERYFLIVFLAYNFLKLLRITSNSEILNTIGKVQKHLNNLVTKSFVCFIYEKSKQNINLEDILIELKIA
jgi:hypothetical protein